MSGYAYDVFISYSRFGNAPKWLMNNFLPKFVDCLTDQMPSEPKVFVDKWMERGTHWPSELESALHHSKIMIAVLTPRYFRSAWCMAEWRSMCERHRLLGIASTAYPQSLIQPILYSDSLNFPEEGRVFSWWDFKRLATSEPSFQESRAWPDFHDKVTEFAEHLAELLQQVPAWQSGWPTVRRPVPLLTTATPMPKFGEP